MRYFRKVNLKKIDYIILEIMVILVLASLYCIFQIDNASANKEGLFTKQILGFVLGLGAIGVIQFIDYRLICKLSPIMYVGICAILVYTFKFGKTINNVRRWIRIAGINFQPSELTKIILILFLAFLCSIFSSKQTKFYPVFLLAIATAIPAFLILKEPHLSPCIVLALIFCIVVLVSEISYKIILTLALVTVPLLATIFIGVGMLHWDIPIIKPYMIERVMDHLSGDSNEDNASDGKYQQERSLLAIKSGSSYGKAIDRGSSPRNYTSIYSNESDFIFAGIAEEYGFIGCSILIILFLILVLRCLKIAAHAPDLVGRIIATAISSLFMFQGFINVGVATNILPNTGMPFPFMSYGLTSLVSSMIGIGLILDIGQECHH